MLFLAPLYILVLSIFTSTFTFTSASPLPVNYHQEDNTLAPYTPVKWLNHFGSRIPDDTVMHLEWEGGSGHGFEVYYIPQWPGQTDYAPVDIANTQEQRFTWRTPKKDAYPQGTTFILGINDALPSLGGGWYDVTGLLTFGR
nr:uncharacterized protein CI109_004890 [Kwoniella shandongensis]KAA5526687.1 hypothetical protein CI109_004890 [Kwoniella shandongensis]